MASLEDLGLNKRLYKATTDPNAYLDSANQIQQSLGAVDFAGGVGGDGSINDDPTDPGSVNDGVQTSVIELQGIFYYRKTTFNNDDAGFRLGVEDGEAKFWFGNSTTYLNLDATPGSASVMVGVEFHSSLSDNAIIIDPVNDEFAAFLATVQTVSITGQDGIALFDSKFTYNGELQPVFYVGEVLGTFGTFVTAPAGWTIVKNSTGIYTITHNLNTDPCYVVCAPRNGHYRYQMELVDANSFRISWEESNYITQSFPVSGGGGGSVSVSGVRSTSNPEVPVDVSFQFILAKPVTP